MKLLTTMLALATAGVLAACGQQTDKDAAAPTNAATESPATMDNGNMTMPTGAAKTAKGTGTVKAIDKTAGTITLHHGPIPEASWPAMTMAFKAPPPLLDGLAVGDEVAFDLKLDEGSGEITAITKQ